MITSAFKNFIPDLIEKTDKQIVKWSKTDDDTFVLKGKNASITISYYLDADRELSFYVLSYLNRSTKSDSGFRVSSEEDEYNLMEKLFQFASASANNIKEELDNFF